MPSGWPTPSVGRAHLGVLPLVPSPFHSTNHNQVHLRFFDPTYGKSSVGWTKFLCNQYARMNEIQQKKNVQVDLDGYQLTGSVAETNFLPVIVIWKFHYLADLENLDHLAMRHLRFVLCLC